MSTSNMESSVFWDIVPCSPLIVSWRFRRTWASQAELYMLVSCLATSAAPKMEAACCSETSVDFQGSIRRYYRKDRTLHICLCDNLKSHMPTICSHIMMLLIFIYIVLKYFTAHLCMYRALNLTCVSDVKKKIKTLIAVIIMKAVIDIYWKSWYGILSVPCSASITGRDSEIDAKVFHFIFSSLQFGREFIERLSIKFGTGQSIL
jgi:hypothetical protein